MVGQSRLSGLGAGAGAAAILFLGFAPAGALAKTDYAGCTSTEVLFNQIYTSILHFLPDTGEICQYVDCGGGRAPPKTVPGCPAYKGTDTVTPSWYAGYTKVGGRPAIPTILKTPPVAILPKPEQTSTPAAVTTTGPVTTVQPPPAVTSDPAVESSSTTNAPTAATESDVLLTIQTSLPSSAASLSSVPPALEVSSSAAVSSGFLNSTLSTSSSSTSRRTSTTRTSTAASTTSTSTGGAAAPTGAAREVLGVVAGMAVLALL
ncbi:hypothetical protein B0H63DRAFT_216395 [Podospora didyma]|uniref:Siderophore biosynthesis enzyme n=1 Tax=Podospora didyma TaxID=330526 RepID=A0AAE0NI25_9PEZI|nr:hypothetical protein B0H63DRAFT_216395 [Podospora didyma]